MRVFCLTAQKKTFQKVCRFRVFEEKYGCTPHIGGKKTYLKSHQVFRERAFPYFHDEIQELVLFHLVTNLANMFISFFACFYLKTLPKAQRTQGLSSYHKFKHKSWLNFIFRIWTKHQLQNLNQTSAFPWNKSFKILTKPSFRILTKIQLLNLNKRSA